jgi:para-aminobenzoate synthetase / 4-amino-4-deoxychorismate lyase
MDKIKPQSTFIKKNEILLKEDGKWLHFSEPHHIIIAEKLEEVLPALREIERRVRASVCYASGVLSYEAASAFEPALQTRAERRSKPGDEAQDAGFPFLWFGLYSKPRVVALPKPVRPKEKLNWEPTIDRETYNAAIAQIKDHIAEGRTYQVNYTMRLRSEFTGNAWNFFLHLVRSQNNHAAFIDTGRYVICSASPELFFQLDGDTITCRPMKGTVKRGRTTMEDSNQSEWLKDSAKNRAENVMIVDMVRNDLGRIAEIGSVRVPKLFETERYPTLWQMTSTVTARTNASLTEIFTALFPCASITGAPKVSTMRIIAELETTPRRVYTGSIGYIAPNRKAKFNVAIRTALIDRETKTAEYGVGGGIVWDSTSADEYAEALLKARVLTEQTQTFSLLETMLWTPAEGFFLKEKHIARLLDSASYFDFPVSSQLRWLSRQRGLDTDFVHSTTAAASKPPLSNEIIETYLNKISSQFTSPQRVRVLLDKNGRLNYESKLFQPSEDHPPLNVCLAKEPIHSGNIFLYHKTTQRGVYESARKDFPDHDDVLLYNEKGELTEFTIGNLVVEMDGKLFTPPISCGLLPGTFRAHLLESGRVVERAIPVQQLKDCAKIFQVNSIRKWQKVRIIG